MDAVRVPGELSAADAATVRRRRGSAGIVLALAASMLFCGTPAAHAAVPAVAPGGYGVRPVCPPAGVGRVRCHVLELTAPSGRGKRGRVGQPGRTVAVAGAAETPECGTPRAREGCYGLRPQDLHAVYGLPQTPVSTQTIAIVAAGGDPTIRKDLANYDSEFGLPGCPGEGPCPTVVNGEGKRHPPAVEGNAPLETSLDVEVAHAVCPGCNLLLVEASSESLAAFEEATDTAARLGADEISISWGEPEPEQVAEEGAAFDHRGVVITAAAGDTGYLNWASPEAERGTARIPRLLTRRDRRRRHRARTGAGRRTAGRTGLGRARTQGRSQRQRLQHAVLRAFLAARTARLGSGRLWRPARHRRRVGDRGRAPGCGRLRLNQGHRRHRSPDGSASGGPASVRR